MPPSPTIIVCERTGRWAEALRVAFRRRAAFGDGRFERPELLETRSSEQLSACLVERRRAGRPASLLLLEATPATCERACAMLVRHVVSGDDAPAIVALADGAEHLEMPLREAGANAILSNLRDSSLVVRIYERYRRDLPHRLHFAENDASRADAWRDRLPWSTK